MMDRFEFSIKVRVTSSRYMARKISEEMAEALESACCPSDYGKPTLLARMVGRVQGMTVEFTGVTPAKGES